MSNAETQSLRCVFYSHPWATLKLEEAGITRISNEVLVEFAQNSLLALTVTPDRVPHKEGLSASLQRRTKIHKSTPKSFFALFPPHIPDPFYQVAEQYRGFAAPLVIAPNPPVSPACQIAALLSAIALSKQVKQITVLIHYQEAEVFSGLFPYVDLFHFLWDIADLPDKKLLDLAQHMTAHRYITTESWGGFHLCDSEQRPISDKAGREGQYKAVINQFFQ